MNRPGETFWKFVIALMVLGISTFHYITPTHLEEFHLIYMMSYFIPILLGAFQFGVKGGLGSAFAITVFYLPHIMLHWTGSPEHTLIRILQVIMFNVIGYLTGLKAEREQAEKERYQRTAEQLNRSLQELQRQSEKLTELEQQLRLLDRLSIVGELTASLAHEVRNPLGSIRGTVEILKDEIPDNPQLQEFFKILVEETERLNMTVENYLSFARRPHGDDVEFELLEVVRNVTTLLSAPARKKGIEVQLKLPDDSIYLYANPNHLRQVIANLLLNAIQVMERGKIQVIVRKGQNNSQPIVEIAVSDEGPGISEKEMGKIFEPFYTTRKDGTGLGLSIVKRIADENRWELQVESTPGKGSTFCVVIPLIKNKAHVKQIGIEHEGKDINH